MRRILIGLPLLLLKLGIAVLSLYAAAWAARRFNLMFGPLRGSKNAALSTREMWQVVRVMLLSHGMLGLLAEMWPGRPPFPDLRRLLGDFYVALVATSVGACFLFVMTVVPFSPNFYVHVYVVMTLLYVACFVIARLVPGVVNAGAPKVTALALLRRVFSVPLLAAACVILLPGVLAVGYKKSENFANGINSIRARMNIATATHYGLVPVIPNAAFEQPMWVEFDPHTRSRFYVLSRPGRLFRYDLPRGENEVLLDLREEVGSIDSEMGALGFALHPQFGVPSVEQRGYVYVLYTSYRPGTQLNRLARFDLSLPTPEARAASRLLLIEQDRPTTGQHNGGTVFFGPEGFLYFTLGDYMQAWADAVTERLSGGVFRIDVDNRGGGASGPILRQPEKGKTAHYSIPKDNPWYAEPNALGEFWALGFRNPFRASVDPATGDVWLGDIGEDTFEEINRVPKGGNCQWPFYEGTQRTRLPLPATTVGKPVLPVLAYQQTALDRAVIGGFLYRGKRLPQLTGKVVYADNNSSTIFAFDPAQKPPQASVLARADKLGQQGITAVVASPDGGIWVTVLGEKARPSGLVLELRSGAAGTVATSSAPPATPEASASYKFEAVCSRCHGSDGRGNPELTEGIAPRPDFTSAAWQEKTPDARMRDVIARGGEAAGLSRDMPGWQGFLSDAELDAMVRKIRALGAGSVPNLQK